MADIKLKDAQGDERTYSGVAKVKIPLADGTGNATFIQPAGKKELTGTNEVDVTNFATAQVVDKNLIAENIKSGVSILGVEGTHEGGSSSGECTLPHIIEVDELPTENIDEGAVYSVTNEDGFYKSIQVANVYYGSMDLGESAPYQRVPTKPTENIIVTNDSGTCIYYVEDENDIFVYGDIEGTGTNKWVSYSTLMGVPFLGVIESADEATGEGLYIIPSITWTNYVVVGGTTYIRENGTVDVTNFANANVSIPTIVEVDELPNTGVSTENIYKCNGAFYRYVVDWEEYIIPSGADVIPEIIEVTSLPNNINSDAIYKYNGKYYWYPVSWVKYSPKHHPQCGITITENGTVDVSEYDKVVVALPDCSKPHITEVNAISCYLPDFDTNGACICDGSIFRFEPSQSDSTFTGIWKLKDIPDVSTANEWQISFKSFGTLEFSGISTADNKLTYYYVGEDYGRVVYEHYWSSGGNYIEITEEPTDDSCKAWIKANGEKQGTWVKYSRTAT